MKRYHEERHITYRNWRNHLRLHQQDNIDRGISPDKIDCVCDQQMGRFFKQDAHDCGKTRCHICHYEKLMKIPTRQKIVADISYREQVKEFERFSDGF